MILMRTNSLQHRIHAFITPFFSVLLIILFLMSALSGCSTYIASKQDDLLTQIDVWSAEDEYGRAIKTLNYVTPSHPQYQQLLARKKNLQIQAQDYQRKINKKVLQLIEAKQWADALDLIDQAKAKYPQGEGIEKTRQHLLDEQKKRLSAIDEHIMLERSQWMIKVRPLYQARLKADPRNDELNDYVDELHKESEELAQKLTQLSKRAIERAHYKTARTRIDHAIALAPSKERKTILSILNDREKVSYNLKQQTQKRTHMEQQNTILLDIEKSFAAGDLIATKQLISELDEKERQNPELIQLEQQLDRTINYTIKRFFSKANKLYTDGQFQKAIELWEKVLLYEPQNALAKENIQRAEKVIDKLTTLREKQK